MTGQAIEVAVLLAGMVVLGLLTAVIGLHAAWTARRSS